MSKTASSNSRPKTEGERLGLLVIGVIVYCYMLIPLAMLSPLIVGAFSGP
ncbi:hypothetical protein [Rhizobium leguminosarum]|nr:hypothetical protein U8Q02_42100 [Rhizobium leguminosarum]